MFDIKFDNQNMPDEIKTALQNLQIMVVRGTIQPVTANQSEVVEASLARLMVAMREGLEPEFRNLEKAAIPAQYMPKGKFGFSQEP